MLFSWHVPHILTTFDLIYLPSIYPLFLLFYWRSPKSRTTFDLAVRLPSVLYSCCSTDTLSCILFALLTISKEPDHLWLDYTPSIYPVVLLFYWRSPKSRITFDLIYLPLIYPVFLLFYWQSPKSRTTFDLIYLPSICPVFLFYWQSPKSRTTFDLTIHAFYNYRHELPSDWSPTTALFTFAPSYIARVFSILVICAVLFSSSFYCHRKTLGWPSPPPFSTTFQGVYGRYWTNPPYYYCCFLEAGSHVIQTGTILQSGQCREISGRHLTIVRDAPSLALSTATAKWGEYTWICQGHNIWAVTFQCSQGLV